MNNKKWALISGLLLITLVGCSSNNKEVSQVTETPAVIQETAPATEQAPAQETAPATEGAKEEATSAEALEAPYEAPEGYGEYQVISHYFAETDENIPMMVGRDSAQNKYHIHFDFFGEEQILEFTVTDDKPEVTYDKSGFIGKDIDKMYEAVKEVKEWSVAQ